MAEKKNTKQVKEVKKAVYPKPRSYIHIDTFLQTAQQLYELSSVEAAGFKAKMRGRHYQHDEKVFLEELKKHFKIED
ncbi:hypothetical protein [Bacillus phage SDFMU_Pbc]|uniref:Uncharacterized protein n=1 Tax=Bacillus phage SDFMU_Pbc TaxID=3076135 RepID=A0AA96KR65_9CAUD|nr:hypothetical protein [Bacillus phage SDFMU_Pbc]